MELTKQQRNEIYKLALHKLKNEIKFGLCTAICPNLVDTLHEKHYINPRRSTGPLIEYFPEFLSFKPKHLSASDMWWGEGEAGNSERVKALEKCIELTND